MIWWEWLLAMAFVLLGGALMFVGVWIGARLRMPGQFGLFQPKPPAAIYHDPKRANAIREEQRRIQDEASANYRTKKGWGC